MGIFDMGRRARNFSPGITEAALFAKTCASKFVIDNPKVEHTSNLKNYQRYLDEKLSQPKNSPRISPKSKSPALSPRFERGSVDLSVKDEKLKLD